MPEYERLPLQLQDFHLFLNEWSEVDCCFGLASCRKEKYRLFAGQVYAHVDPMWKWK